ncbi:MAG TPA: recombinase family protein [Accumulibacter sp.]|nr:recombinase family protein [Accumulibacter sp.]HNG39821.1 recombinase family protein [Accumulibacter sp.]HNL12747.1 recombinase family protein [Accumulibacter sp.]HNL77305.1 recombinase family protein [Accumulibacter sp.]HNM75322.1 recombinase family protein [Accumulibacter sp.]
MTSKCCNSHCKIKFAKRYKIVVLQHLSLTPTAYARVSTDDQVLDLQLDALRGQGIEAIYQEHASGKSRARPELDNCLKALRAGDTLVVWRLDRLGRNLADLVQIVGALEERGVGFESLTEQINTHSPTGKLVFHLFASLAEFERNLIRERTQAGLKAARARGRHGGRPKKLNDREKAMAKSLMADPRHRGHRHRGQVLHLIIFPFRHRGQQHRGQVLHLIIFPEVRRSARDRHDCHCGLSPICPI